MKSTQLDQLKADEERERAAAYDPVQRWEHIQQTITWAEANLPPHLRRNLPPHPRPRGKASNSAPQGSSVVGRVSRLPSGRLALELSTACEAPSLRQARRQPHYGST